MNLIHASLFSGIGGFDYAAALMGWDNLFHCEWNEFCQKVLAYHFPNSIPHHDITKTDFSIYRGRVDILSGGFPCQGNSLAGKRLGTDDDRYLWPEMLRAIDECQPTCIVGENVTGILSMEDKSGIYRDVFAKVEDRKVTRFHEVDCYEAIYTRQAKMLVNSICESLEERGYEVQTFAIPAASVQAPHTRERIWFVAYASCKRHERGRFGENRSTPESGKTEGIQRERVWYDFERVGKQRAATDTCCAGREKLIAPNFSNQQGHGAGCFTQSWDNWPTQSPVCSRDDGLSARLDGITFSKWRNESIKAGGNAIVPQVALQIFKAIEEYKLITSKPY